MEVLSEAHGPPGFSHADGYFVFLEHLYKHHSGGQHVSVSRGSTPVKDTGLYWTRVLTEVPETVHRHHPVYINNYN